VVVECLDDRRHVLPVEHLVAGHYFRFCTNWKPKRPLTQRLPRVTSWSSGEVTLTISSSCTCSVRLQPTPQYGQTVSTWDCSSSCQSPVRRSSNSLVNMSAPVGQTAMQLPQ